MAVLILTCALAGILGFAAHRASICTVRAVAELISSRTAHMLVSIGKSMLWVVAVTVPFFLLVPSAGTNLPGWPLTTSAVLGGCLFGIGAGINGACSYSTMARLVDGEVGMLAACIAFGLGILCFVSLVDFHWLDRPVPGSALMGTLLDRVFPQAAVLAALALMAWGVIEATRLWRTRPTDTRLHGLALAPQYRLSSAAMLIGFASSAIFLIYGSTSYTVTMQQVIEGIRGSRGFPATARWLVLLSVLGGMLLSTLQRGTFRLDWRPRLRWFRNIVGGLLMGLGVALAPGGNDALVLYSIPILSPHAVPAFIAMLFGILLGLSVMRAVFGIEMRVACRNDRYIANSQTREAPAPSVS